MRSKSIKEKNRKDRKFTKGIRHLFIKELGIDSDKGEKGIFFLDLIRLGLDIEQIVELREELFAALAAKYRIEADGFSLLEKLDNKKMIEKLGFTVQNKNEVLNEVVHIQRKTELTTDDILALIANDTIPADLGIKKIVELSSLEKMSYSGKFMLFKILNSENKKTDLSEKILKSILSNDIGKQSGVPYVRLGDFYNPHFSNGNAGLIIELIVFALKENTHTYGNWIRSLGEGINHSYAKSTGLYSGLAGLGMGNAHLYHYFHDLTYLRRSVKIADHLRDYSFKVGDSLNIADPSCDTVNYGYSRGMLGQFCFIDDLIGFMKSEG